MKYRVLVAFTGLSLLIWAVTLYVAYKGFA
jgi:hypothetical protein